MTRYCLLILLVLFFTACKDKASEKKLVTSDSTGAVQDSINQVNTITPLHLDSITATPAQSTSTGPILLKFNLPAGKSFAYNTSIEINQEMPGQKIHSTMAYNYTLKVNQEGNDTRQLTVTYNDLSIIMDMNGKKMSFGSGQKEEPSNPLNMLGKMLTAMKGKSFLMEVKEDGNISRVEGFDKIADAVIEEMQIPEASRESFAKNFKSRFNENSVKQMFAESFNVFPGKKVKPGDTWQKKVSLPMANAATEVFTTYKLKGLLGNNYIVDASTKYQNAGSKAVIGTSRLLIDAATGLIVQLDGEQKLEGSNTVISRSRVRSKQL